VEKGKMNYRSLEDYFLKVEKRFLIVAGHISDYSQDNVIQMIAQNLYFKLKIYIPNSRSLTEIVLG
jgi:hypothetical protein